MDHQDEIDFINELLRDAADDQVAEFYAFQPPDEDERYDPTDEDWPWVAYITDLTDAHTTDGPQVDRIAQRVDEEWMVAR